MPKTMLKIRKVNRYIYDIKTNIILEYITKSGISIPFESVLHDSEYRLKSAELLINDRHVIITKPNILFELVEVHER